MSQKSNQSMTTILSCCLLSLMVSLKTLQAGDQLISMERGIPQELKEVGITENLGAMVPISELMFRDEQGQVRPLGDFFKPGIPVLLSLIYYGCPSLCGFMLNGMNQSLKKLDYTPGDQFQVIHVSIHPLETPELARRKKMNYLKDYGRLEKAQMLENGWHFLTGDETNIRKLADVLGFHYRWDESAKEYAHAAAAYVLTGEGKISRYWYGIDYSPGDLRLSLLEASRGKIGTLAERMMLFCFRYNPQTKKYSVYVSKLMNVACGVTILGVLGYLFVFWLSQRRKEKTIHV